MSKSVHVEMHDTRKIFFRSRNSSLWGERGQRMMFFFNRHHEFLLEPQFEDLCWVFWGVIERQREFVQFCAVLC